MKKLSTLPLFLLLALVALVSACGDDDKEDDPAPKTYKISVHIIGTGLAGTYTTADISSEHNFAGTGTPSAGPSVLESYSNNVDKTYDLGTFGDYDIVEVQLASAAALPASATLRAEILVDGKVKSTAQLPETTAIDGYCAVETDDL